MLPSYSERILKNNLIRCEQSLHFVCHFACAAIPHFDRESAANSTQPANANPETRKVDRAAPTKHDAPTLKTILGKCRQRTQTLVQQLAIMIVQLTFV